MVNTDRYFTRVRIKPSNISFKIEGNDIRDLWHLAYRTARALKNNKDNEARFVTFRIYERGADRMKYNRVMI